LRFEEKGGIYMNEHLRRSILELSKAQRETLYRRVIARDGATSLVETPGRLLAAWIVPHKAGINLGELRTFLAGVLPGHMIPDAFEVLEKLPLTPGGKVDRQALLREGRVLAQRESDGSALNTRMETLLGRIWCEVMEIDRVGRHDNFFDLGGHSLMALRLIAKISRAVQKDLSVRFLFMNPTIELQAKELEHQRASLPPAVATSSTGEGHVRTDSLVLKARPDIGVIEGECGTVDAVALGYLSSEMARVMGWSVEGMMSRWFVPDGPVVDGVIETRWGRIGGITLPYLDTTLYDAPEELIRNIILALKMAKRLGAKVVTMTGLIPSATDSGSAVVRAIAAAGMVELPTLSTGHATTSAAVVLNIGRIVQICGRDLSAERVAFVGLGSIGVSTLRLMLRCMPHPGEIILCDVYARSGRLHEIRDELMADFQFRGPVHLAPARGEIPAEVYRASLIVGATNVPDVLDIERVMPGTMIVDDSAPHCFSTAAAIARLETRRDIVFSEGGIMGLPEPIREIAYHPALMVDPTILGQFADFLRHDAASITGCVFSGLLSATYALPPTIGAVATEELLAHYSALRSLGFTGGMLLCDSHVLRQETLERFRDAFGGQ
jgi:predicted amino acid dehydrogenase